MDSYKKDFPIFRNNPGLIFLDSASTTQKPGYVIDGVKHYLEHGYSNIHRGAYLLSEKSEELYELSKEKVRALINAKYRSEITYTYNSNYAVNLLATSLRRSRWLKRGDRVLLSVKEHHANIVPWLILKEEIGIEVDYIGIDDSYDIDLRDLEAKLTDDVRVVALTYASNVTGNIVDCKRVGEIIREKAPDVLYVVDASQAVPNFKVDVQDLDCDFLFFTGHKIMADTGIGVLYGKREHLKALQPGIGGGGAINWVRKELYSPAGLPFRFEPGTPNIVGAVSLLKAIEYLDSIGSYEMLQAHEHACITYFLERFEAIRDDRVSLLGKKRSLNRIGVFSFDIKGGNASDIAEFFADEGVCIRAGHHCAQPLMEHCGVDSSVRASMYLYTDLSDIDAFFEALSKYLKQKRHG